VLLQSVLQNLIHNAINYSNRQSPQISIVATQNADTIEFRVADNGDGIAADVQPRIFDMFYRGHQDSNGSGLGLFIVKNALEKMHGTVRFQSDKGAGTTFIVTLPKRLPEA
jgi:signal transduction histidine kinase